ncbi:MAG: SIMPL domain-containing protein [Nocardioidaceae bacterium]
MSEVHISVRGTAEGRYAAERATVNARVALEDPDRETVRRRTLDVVERTQGGLGALAESGAVASWSADQVRVFAERPRKRGEPQPLVHHARVSVRAEFVDFDALADWVSALAAVDGVEVQGIGWDVEPEQRRAYEAEVRRNAVADAMAKARAYADAIGRESVEPTQLADAGMLDGDQDDRPMTMAAAGGEPDRPRLRLKPRDIVVRVAVDARFAAR